MNAPLVFAKERIRTADLGQPDEAARIERFVAAMRSTVFHRPAWLRAIECGTGQRARGLLAERGGTITGWLPLTEVHSPIFGRMLASSGFAVGGGALALAPETAHALCRAAEGLADRLSCSTIELRGGDSPGGWSRQNASHCGFAAPLAADCGAQLLAVPRKHRAEVRKSLAVDFQITVGKDPELRRAHYGVYAESVRNLGTPVFPRSLFEACLDQLDADILTVSHHGRAVASVLSLYHEGAVLPYWGGGILAARSLRANERMYFELMRHARERGCEVFDFGRSKTDSGAWAYKKNWGFEPQPLSYANWTAPGAERRDADPTSGRHAARIALWRKLPLAVANRLGPVIARGLG